MRCLASVFFFCKFAMSQFDWAITIKNNLWRLPKIEGSNLKYRARPLWPNICQT